MLLDEPFSALDATLRTGLRDEVASLLRASGTTALLVTHDRDEALSWADVVTVMDHGAVLQAGAPREVYLRPRSEQVARLLGDLVVLPARDAGGRLVADLARLCSPGGADGPLAGFRPEQVVADPGGVPAIVTDVRFRGHDGSVVVRVGGHGVTARWSSLDLPAVGEAVEIGVRGVGIPLG